ncbi:MAG: Release factor glutamine methyltransferase [Candidatus Dichloromethanomonas elyunquensis]|nr:MAG: Release factor glutamine methyltransferase [Candidatus Dichloromethanomonas elyunquensis]
MEKDLFSVKTINVLKKGTNYLESKGIIDARADADLLLASVRGTTRDKLYLDLNREISFSEEEQFQGLLRQRGEREPLAYLLKNREFMGLEFYVDRNVLIPRPETELLVEKVLDLKTNYFRNKSAYILDLGTGSGAVAVAASFYWPKAQVLGTDVSEKALMVAEKNALAHYVRVEFRLGDLFKPVSGEKFDIIISNPPYVAEEEYEQCSPEVKNEPSLALIGGKDGLDFYRRIADEAEYYLKPGGVIILEIGCSQGEAVKGLFTLRGYKTFIFLDFAGHDRIVTAKKE